MDVWCKAICCRHINFKAVFQSTSEHAIFIQKIEIFSGEGHSPSHIPPPAGRGKPLLHPPTLGAYGASTLAPWALNPWSPVPGLLPKS